jgi:hypothetical protein
MKKIIGLFLIFLFILSCNDGDFDVPSFDFDEQTVQNCGDLVLFKINESEAIVFSINENNSNNTFFKQEMSNETFDLTNISISSTISSIVLSASITFKSFLSV